MRDGAFARVIEPVQCVAKLNVHEPCEHLRQCLKIGLESVKRADQREGGGNEVLCVVDGAYTVSQDFEKGLALCNCGATCIAFCSLVRSANDLQSFDLVLKHWYARPATCLDGYKLFSQIFVYCCAVT